MQILLAVSLISIFLLVKAQGDPFDFGSDWSDNDQVGMSGSDREDSGRDYQESDHEYERPLPNRHRTAQADDIRDNKEDVRDNSFEPRERSRSRRRRSSSHHHQDSCAGCHLERSAVDLCMIDPSRNETVSYFSFGGVTGDDGESWYCEETGSYMIDSTPFRSWVPPSNPSFLDHIKYILVSDESYDIPPLGIQSFEFKATVNVKGLSRQSFPPEMLAESNDPRLGAGCFSTIDVQNGFIIGFMVTNDRIYAHYERLTFARQFVNGYAAFAMLIPLAERCKDDCNRMRVTFDGRIQQVSFFVDGVRKYWIDHLGFIPDRRLVVLDEGGEQECAWPRSVQYLFGTATLLNFYPVATNPACRNPYEDDSVCGFAPVHIALVRTGDEDAPAYDPYSYGTQPAQYYDPSGEQECKHIWGQGVNINLDALKLDTLQCLLDSPIDGKAALKVFN